MEQYSLASKGEGFYFEKGSKKSSPIFYSKEEGANTLLTLFERQLLSAKNAISLLEEIAAFAFFPITKRITGEIDWIEEDLNALVKISKLKHVLSMFQDLEKFTEPKIVLCPDCGKHASIIGPKFLSGYFKSKEEGEIFIEDLKDRGVIDLAEQFQLQKELAGINLPEKISNPIRDN